MARSLHSLRYLGSCLTNLEGEKSRLVKCFKVQIMNRKMSHLLKALVATGIAIAASSSHASLIGGTFQSFSGTGLGAVDTVLSIQSPANTSTETGAVAWNGTTNLTTGNVVLTGASQSLTRTIADIGATSAADLRVVFNPSEPVPGDTITLNNLVLSIYSPTGATLFTSGAFTPQTFNTAADQGTGKSGFVFQLDAAQAAAAQAAAFTGNTFTQNRIGLSASASNATGGLETFYMINIRGGGGAGGGGAGGAVPEPATIAMLGLGLAALGVTRRRKG